MRVKTWFLRMHILYCNHTRDLSSVHLCVESTVSMSIGSYKCPMCQFETPTMVLNLSHLRLLHSNDPRFSVQCGIDSCSYTGGSFSALYSHIYRHHPHCGIIEKRRKQGQIAKQDDSTLPVQQSALALPDCEDFSGILSNQGVLMFQYYYLSFSFTTEGFQADLDLLLGTSRDIQQRSSALFLLKLKDFPKLRLMILFLDGMVYSNILYNS